MKCAVIYYSKTGVTKRIADQIQAKFNADVYLVEPEKAYGGFLSSVARVVRSTQLSRNCCTSGVLFSAACLPMISCTAAVMAASSVVTVLWLMAVRYLSMGLWSWS